MTERLRKVSFDQKNIAVNGQHLTINCSGGAGRYAQQIYKRLINALDNKLTGYDVQTINFQRDERQETAEVNPARKSVSMLKHAIYQCSPPFIYNILLKAYQHVDRCLPKAAQDVNFVNAKQVEPSNGLKNIRLLHELTNYMSHSAIARLCLSPNFALAVTFLDIQDFYYPEYFNDSILNTRRMIYSFYKDRADVFFAISDFTKQTMIEQLNINPSKIKVTHLAADDLLILKPTQEVYSWAESFGRFWVYPAKVWKHKNHGFLLRSLGKRKSALKQAGVKILLTGGFNKAEVNFLNSLTKINGLDAIIRILGFVSDDQLQALLQRAEFLVFPSLFEGFGMPTLEAMILGCPVISSNAGSLPEVAGDAAVFFNPTNEEEFVDLIDSILFRTEIDRDSMIKKGLENCARFSWDSTYQKTVDVYKDLL